MPQTLFATLRNNDEPIALPCFRIGFILDGMLDQPANRETGLAMLELFRADFSDQLAFMVLGSATGKPGKLVRYQADKLNDWQALIAEGMPKNRGLRLYGSDQNPLSVPFLPYFSLDQDRHPMTRIEICIAWQADRMAAFSDGIDAIARASQVRFGYQGFGFAHSPIAGFQDRWLPPAFRRYRSALMGKILGHEAPLFYSKSFVTMRRLDQQRRGEIGAQPWDYTPGIPDMGWRTYVGRIFADRLNLSAPPADPAVIVDVTDRMVVITAGPAPIWGDLNDGEDISAWRAAYDVLRPAFASKNILRAFTLDCDPADPGSVETVDDYLNRFA